MKKIMYLILMALFCVSFVSAISLTEEQFLNQDFSGNKSLNYTFNYVSHGWGIEKLENYVMVVNKTFLVHTLEINGVVFNKTSNLYDVYRYNISSRYDYDFLFKQVNVYGLQAVYEAVVIDTRNKYINYMNGELKRLREMQENLKVNKTITFNPPDIVLE